jgi:uncharacterized protein (DUF2141 family)
LFTNEKGFPDDGTKAYKTWKFIPSDQIVLDNIPPGTYALSLLHDLDNDLKMSYNFVGFPKDGYSASPNGGQRFSKPVFEKSTFTHSRSGTELYLQIHY